VLQVQGLQVFWSSGAPAALALNPAGSGSLGRGARGHAMALRQRTRSRHSTCRCTCSTCAPPGPGSLAAVTAQRTEPSASQQTQLEQDPTRSRLPRSESGRSQVPHVSRQCGLKTQGACPIMQVLRPRSRHSVTLRGRGTAGGPSAGGAEPGLRNRLAASALRLRPGRSPLLHSSRQYGLQARAGLGHCCPIMRRWRPRSRHSVTPRGRGAAGGPSAEP
jgi:hypothetical protein